MKYAVPITRALLGLPFLVFGLNFFFLFFPLKMEEMSASATAFMNALTKTEFMHPLRAGTEVFVGALLVVGLWVPLALVMLAPILVHIIGFHLYLDPGVETLGFTSVLVVLFLIQAWVHRTNFKCLLNARPKAPSAG